MSDLHLDPERIDAKLEAERVRLVAALRRVADCLERVPVSKVSEPLTALAGWIEKLERSAERVLRGAVRTRFNESWFILLPSARAALLNGGEPFAPQGSAF